ncbi:MAG: YitT family protein [Chitinophagaceae bacterium]|nr:YitT family protein [Chitinophagaceae bacterium]
MGLIKNIRDAIFILIGVFSAAFGLEGFLLKNHFIDGGATGVSLLLSGITGWSLSIVIVLVNLPFIIMGNNHLGRIFAIKTCLAIMALALVLYFFDFPIVTNDKLLVAVFGGFFLGVGVGLSVRGGAVIDGTEVLAIYLSRKLGATIGDVVFIINVLIFSAAAYLLSIETALYSMITYLAVSKTLDFIVEGIEEYMGVTIISSHHEEIRMMIIHELGRGVTIYSGKGGYGKRGERKKELEILYTVITRLELNKINTEIEKIDPNAFVVMHTIKDTRGGMIKKRPLVKK